MIIMIKKGIGLIAIVVIVAFVIATYGGNIPFSITGQVVPLTTESITPVNQSGNTVTFVSNDSDLANVDFLINVQAGNVGNDKLIASNLGLSGVTFNNTADIDITSIIDFYEYPIINESGDASTNVYEYQLSTVGLFDNCPSGSTYQINSGLFGSTKYCIRKDLVANTGHLGTPNYFNSVDSRVIISGETYNYLGLFSVDNTNQTNVDIRDGSGNFFGTLTHLGQYNSNLVSPTTSEIRLRKGLSENQWGLVETSFYNDYTSKRDELDSKLSELQSFGFTDTFSINLGIFDVPIGSCVFTNCENYLDDIINATNNAKGNVTGRNVLVPYPNASTNQFWSAENGAKYRIELIQDVFQYPKLQYRLDAQAIGVRVEVGTPTGLSVNPSNLNVQVGDSQPKNVQLNFTSSNGSGNYIGRLKDCSLATLSNSTTATLNSGVAGSINVTLLPIANSSQSGSCTYCVTNTSVSSNEICASGTINILETQVCTPGNYDVRGNQIWQCNSGGTDFDFVKSCSEGIVYENGVPTCKVSALCGNGVIDSGESCDGTDLGGDTCNTIGYESGTLSCGNTCKFVTSQCTGVPLCENGQIPLLQNNVVVGCEDCSDKPTNLLITGHEIVQKNSPEYLLGWIPIQIGTTQELYCADVYNIPLIIISIVGVVSGILIVYGLFIRRKKK
jgi:hypothetical protein